MIALDLAEKNPQTDFFHLFSRYLFSLSIFIFVIIEFDKHALGPLCAKYWATLWELYKEGLRSRGLESSKRY